MTQHNLDGIFFRIERDGKWMNVCLSDMTTEERENVIKLWVHERDTNWFKGAIHHLCDCLYKVGEQQGLYGIREGKTDD